MNVGADKPVVRSFRYRNFAKLNFDLFGHELLASDVCTNPKSTANEFALQLRDEVTRILDKLAPSKLVTRRFSKRTAGWLSKEAVDSRRSRRTLERRYRRTHLDEDRVAYRRLCRTTNKLINQSRQQHIAKRLDEASGNSRLRWRIANEILHKSDCKVLKSNDDCQGLCNSFAKYFTHKLSQIAQTIASQLSLNTDISTAIADWPSATSLDKFDTVTVNDVKKIIDSCPQNSSPLDFIPFTVIKRCRDVFAPVICHLANLSFSSGVFPDVFKVGQVTPLIKKATADASDPASYRPITNLNSIGKLLERLAQQQLRRHIGLSANQNAFQSAYRAVHSTETAMTKVVNDLLTTVDSKRPSLLLSLDISAAFDTLDHSRLLQRANQLFGLTGRVNDWLKSYLSGRSSYVAVSGCRSPTVQNPTGVPQGSVLGPLLFSIFTTPVGRLISSFNIDYHQYADDTQLYTSIDLSCGCRDLSRLSSCADAVTRWHLENGLLLNPSKTEALVTGTHQQVAKFSSSGGIRVANAVVPLSSTVRILGVTIDQHLTFDDHVTKVVQSCNYHMRSLRHIRKLIDKDTANLLACSLVLSRLDYCNALLYHMTDKNVNRLQRVQKSLARIVCQAPYRSPSTPLLKELHWLPIRQRIDYKIAVLTYKARLHRQPSYLHDLIQDYIPPRVLRSSDAHLLSVPSAHTKTASRAFCVAAPTVWNSLPLSVRTLPTVSQFCRHLKTHLFECAYH